MHTADLDRYVISPEATIRDALHAINLNEAEFVAVVDPQGVVLGVITDGDIRRGLLRDLTLADRAVDIMTRDFISIQQGADRAAALDLMKALVIRQLPILAGKRLVGLHLFGEILGAVPRPNRAVIMAGGRGTRLRPYTETVPKPMIPVAGRPLLERIVLHLVGHGIRNITLAVNYLGDQIERHFEDGRRFGCSISYLREQQELGTAGALSLIENPPAEPLIVMNGDQITRVDFGAMLAFHDDERPAMTMAVGPYQHEIPFGVVEAEGSDLKRIEEKPTIQVIINRGIYILSPELLKQVPQGRPFTMVDLTDLCQQESRKVSIFYTEDEWIDVGRPADLARANGTTLR